MKLLTINAVALVQYATNRANYDEQARKWIRVYARNHHHVKQQQFESVSAIVDDSDHESFESLTIRSVLKNERDKISVWVEFEKDYSDRGNLFETI